MGPLIPLLSVLVRVPSFLFRCSICCFIACIILSNQMNRSRETRQANSIRFTHMNSLTQLHAPAFHPHPQDNMDNRIFRYKYILIRPKTEGMFTPIPAIFAAAGPDELYGPTQHCTVYDNRLAQKRRFDPVQKGHLSNSDGP